ncbi:MAG: antibiotic biosynthesis monooxygenase [Candidatus Hydrogenedentes bacterium]|nr:antibiotic biosynthesis monooxygenase [Candidatus Hydrogenedentota bacterium]
MTNENTGTTRREFAVAGAAAAAAMTFGFNRMAQADSNESAVISQIVKFKINMDNEEGAIKALQDLAKGVEETEPGVLVYIAHRSKADPSEVVFFEVYADEAAVQAHQGTPHMNAMRAGFVDNFRPPLEIQQLDRVSGFTR